MKVVNPYMKPALILVLTICCLQVPVLAKKKIIIGVFVPMSSGERDQYGYRLAFDMGMDSAKNSTKFAELFGEYDVEMKYIDTYKMLKVALHFLHEVMTECKGNRRPSLILGPAFYNVMMTVAQANMYYRVPQILYNSVPHNLDDSRYFKNIAANVPSYDAFNDVTAEFLKYFEWKKVALFYSFLEENGWYIQVTEDLTKKLKANDIEVNVEPMNTIGYGDSPGISRGAELHAKLKKYKEKDTRIFLGQFGAPGALGLFCEVYKLGLYGPQYVWIINKRAGELNVWLATNLSGRAVDCTKEQMHKVAESIITMDRSELRVDNVTTMTGKNAEQYKKAYEKKRMATKWQDDKLSLAPSYAFDSTWLSLFALQGAMKGLHRRNLTLDTNITDNRKFLSEIEAQFETIHFEGVTGPVKFETLQSGLAYKRKGIVAINQMKGGKFYTLGQYYTTKKENPNSFNKTLLFPDGVPLDGARRVDSFQDVPLALFATFSAGAILGILMAAAFLVFNVYHRKYKFIRLSAPTFNNIIVLGCILCLSTVFLFGIHVVDKDVFRVICKCRAWILTIGFSFAFGAMFVKTWRIYKICTNKRLKMRLGPMSDWYLLAIIAGIVLVDVIILITWEIVDPLKENEVKVFEERPVPNDPNTILIPKLNICMSQHLDTWLSLIYVYKGILLLYGLFLAYETRNVAYAHLNDSRTIGVCVYNVVVLSTIGAFMGMVLHHSYFTHLYVIISVCIIFPSSATIGLIFFPKIIFRMKITNPDEDMTMPPHTRTSMDFTSTMQTDYSRGQTSAATSTNTVCMQINGHPPSTPSSQSG